MEISIRKNLLPTAFLPYTNNLDGIKRLKDIMCYEKNNKKL